MIGISIVYSAINWCIKPYWERIDIELLVCPADMIGKQTVKLPAGIEGYDIGIKQSNEVHNEFPKWLQKQEEKDKKFASIDAAMKIYLMENKVPQEPLFLYYGVWDSQGLEWFVDEDAWWNIEDSIRYGSYRWWLDWCSKGGRHGSSMPFSIYLTKNQAKEIIKLGQDKVVTQFINQNPLMGGLYPWSQHMKALEKKTLERAAKDGWSEDEEGYVDAVNEIYNNLMHTYASNRQQMAGLLKIKHRFL